MNDLERDLQNLFEQRARDVDPSVLAPETIVRRGHRRQARTVVGGVLAGVVAIAVAVAAVGSIQRPNGETPGGPQQLPARSTSIGGVPVTAPAGWTLVDDWPLAAQVPTSTQSCSFSGSGTPVDANGSPIAGSPQPEPSQSCSSQPASPSPALPVLQLANFEIPLMQTVCGGLGDNDPAATLPANGVAVYVVAHPADPSNGDGADTSFAEGCGPGAWTMTQFLSADGTIRYAAIFLQGSEASPVDKTFASDYINSLDGESVTPTTWDSPRGPAYVLAAGGTAQEGWRLEAGITSFDMQDGTPTLGAALVTTTSSDEGSRTLPPATHAQPVVDDYSDVGDGVVQFGTATSAVTSIDLVTGDGGTTSATSATMFPWPIGLGLFPNATVPSPSGWVWFAEGNVRADVVPTMAASAGPAPSPEPSVTDPAGSPLDYTVLDSGAVVATGNDFGADWQLKDAHGELHLIFNGVDQGWTSIGPGGGYSADVDGGTLQISRQPMSVDSVTMSSDVAGNDVIATGRWMPSAADALAGPGRVWVLALPGAGWGYSHDGFGLPIKVGWPTRQGPPQAGDVMGGGSDARISWTLEWTSPSCPVVEVAASAQAGDTGTSPCLTPWDGNTPVIGGVYGEHTALVVITGPQDLECELGMSGGPPTVYGEFAQTGICYVSVPVGDTMTVQLTGADGNPILGARGRITLQAEPGRLNMTN